MKVVLLSLASAASFGCTEKTPPSETVAKPATTTTPATAEPRRGYEIPIPQIEFWDPERTTLKYTYEMRFDPAGPGEKGPRLHRNGWARAYYGSGRLEREGAYRFDRTKNQSDRVGTWIYYDTEGNPSRTEERGGEVIWTGPDQLVPPPGTEPGSSPSGTTP
ncbi:MAG: hypothetical protein GY895_19555 [Phycisphaera sp.]|nr:hypothetical protein [Phycisphaera sp.]